MHTLQTLNMTFDIIAILGTWTESEVTTAYDLHTTRSFTWHDITTLYVNDRIECTLIESTSVVVENIFECITVELNMRKVKNIIVSCMHSTPDANETGFLNPSKILSLVV